jgi:hypothetical protein
MKSNKHTFGTLVLGFAYALGATGLLVAGTQSRATLPEEPTHGSIRLSDDASHSSMLNLAKLSAAQAQEAATERASGKIIETELEEEDGFLFWEVKVLGNDGTKREVYIDAGNGEVVAID